MTETLENFAPSRKSSRDLDVNMALLAIGVVQSLRLKKLNVDQSRKVLFNLPALQEMKSRRADPRLIEMMAWGMELPNVQRLVPEGLEESCKKIEALANSIVAAGRKPHLRMSHKISASSKPRATNPISEAIVRRVRKAERQMARGLVTPASKLRRK